MSHDIGVIGVAGLGLFGQLPPLSIDILIGSFSKAFGTNGGFVTTADPNILEAIRYRSDYGYSNGASPLQIACAMGALSVITGPEGEALRASLGSNSQLLMELVAPLPGVTLKRSGGLAVLFFEEPRRASEFVPFLRSRAVLANLVEYPAVPKRTPRVRLQLMAKHSPGEIHAVGSALTDFL